MRYIILSLMCLSCADNIEQDDQHFRERKVVVCACNNPQSIWHLSECNDECTRRDYTGQARCECITDVQCEENRTSSEFLRRACGLYY